MYMRMNTNEIQQYPALLRQVKQRVLLAQQRAIFAANEELLRMYWDLGQLLYESQQREGWGKGTLTRLSQDMKNEFPKEKGFSVRNFQCMMQFFNEYNQELTSIKTTPTSIVQRFVTQLEDCSSPERNLHKYAIVQPSVAQLAANDFMLPIKSPITNSVKPCRMTCVPACQALRKSKRSWK